MTSLDVAMFGQICFVIIMSIGALAGIGVTTHSYLQRSKRKQQSLQPILDDDRFLRLEQSVEAIAIEVERISEGQRYMTKLQAERPAALP